MHIMRVQQLLVGHLSAAEFGQTFKVWRVLAVSLTNYKDPDDALVFESQGIGKKVAKTNYAEKGADLVSAYNDLHNYFSRFENEMSVTTSQTTAKKCEDWVRM